MHLPAGTTLQGGKYKIVGFIKSGGFGCTYEGEQSLLGARVAIKELFVSSCCNRENNNSVAVGTKSKVDDFAKFRKNFIKEASILYKLHHPNIVRVTDVFEENGTAYYVMDYIEGYSLADLVESKGKLSEEEALGFIRQACEALKFVHSHNRMHRDIKPGNIMVDTKGNVFLIDFGASKYYDEDTGEQTSTLMGIYTNGYAPPEQRNGSVTTFNPATEVYSLGATMYKLLTGITPPDSLSILIRTAKLEPLPDTISEQTRNAVMAALELFSDKRPQSIQEFEDILDGKTTNGADSKQIIPGATTGTNSSKTNSGTNSGSYSSINDEKADKSGESVKPSGSKEPSSSKVTDSNPSIGSNSSNVADSSQSTGSNSNNESNSNKSSNTSTEPSVTKVPNNIQELNSNNATSTNKTPLYNRENSVNKEVKEFQVSSQQHENKSVSSSQNSNQNNRQNNTSEANSSDTNHSDANNSDANKSETNNSAANNTSDGINASKSDKSAKLASSPISGSVYAEDFTGSSKNKSQHNKDGAQGAKSGSEYADDFAGKRNKNPKYKPQAQQDEDKGLDEKAKAKKKRKRKIASIITLCFGVVLILACVFAIGDVTDDVSPYEGEELAKEAVVEEQALGGTINGYEWVDLELPSGLKWATYNVGASSPEFYGDYFAWGEVTTKPTYDAENSETYGKSIGWLREKGYIDDKGNLRMSHDVAHQNWGGTWRMPTRKEWEELESNTYSEWTTLNGVNGRLLTSKKNNLSIFLPAAGLLFGEKQDAGGHARYWSSTPDSKEENQSYNFYFYEEGSNIPSNDRSRGRTVRAVSK